MRWITISKMNKYDNSRTVEKRINSVLDEYGLSREEFWKDPKAFIDKLDNQAAKLMLAFYMGL